MPHWISSHLYRVLPFLAITALFSCYSADLISTLKLHGPQGMGLDEVVAYSV